MTTVIIASHTVSLTGHAGNRDVCVSLSALSQVIAALASEGEAKERGEHVIAIRDNAWLDVEIVLGLIRQLAEQYPKHVRVIDARRYARHGLRPG